MFEYYDNILPLGGHIIPGILFFAESLIFSPTGGLSNFYKLGCSGGFRGSSGGSLEPPSGRNSFNFMAKL